MKQMSRRERILAAVNREPVDRVPYAVWRHFPAVDRSPAGLAQATLRFHERYGSDFVKITPRGGYAVEAWGCVEGDTLREDGHRPCTSCAVRGADDWKKIRPLDPGAAAGYTEHIETIVRMGFDRRIGDAPVLPTLFSPLSLARKLSGDRLQDHLREHPDRVRGALEAITETLVRFAALALAEGVSGIFYSIQAASLSVNAEEDYRRFGEPYDRQVLESVRGKSLLTIVHCHGDRLMFERLALGFGGWPPCRGTPGTGTTAPPRPPSPRPRPRRWARSSAGSTSGRPSGTALPSRRRQKRGTRWLRRAGSD